MGDGGDEIGSVKVVARFRPLNPMEIDKGGKMCVDFPETADGQPRAVKYKGMKNQSSRMSLPFAEDSRDDSKNDYFFDRVFDPVTRQQQIFDTVGRQIVEDVINGYNGTIFAYGQTGSGKTHTMEGDLTSEDGRGLIPRMVGCIFESIMEAEEDIEFTVKVSYLEIYLERIKDLLDPTKENLQIHEEKTRGIWVGNATETYVMSEEEVLDLLHQGHRNRQVASTNMNAVSSRSHSIFIITVGQRNVVDMSVKTGKLYLVDLAGSEKVSKTGAEGQQLEEAKNINKSLSALGNVINALTDGKSTHIPYRDSKLTRILQESIGGNSRTALIICCSPSQYNDLETLSTIRFGQRAKKVRNKPKINQERSLQELKMLLAKAEAEIERLQSRVDELEDQLEQTGGSGAVSSTGNSRYAVLQEKYRQLEREKEETEQKKDEINEELEALKQEIEEGAIGGGRVAAPGGGVSSQQLEDMVAANSALQQEVTELRLRAEKAEYECKEKSLTIESMSQANKILIAEMSEMREAGSGSGDAGGLNKLMSAWQNDDDRIQARHKEILSDLQSSLSGEGAAHERQKRGSQELMDETVAALKNRIDELERVKKNLNQEVLELRTRSSELEAIVSANEQSRVAHEEGEDTRDVESVIKENDDLKWELNKLRANKDNLDKYVAEREASFQQQEEDWRTHKDKLEEDFRALRDQLRSKLAEFDQLKQALYKDLRNRCDKVVNLEKSLHDTKEQYDELLAQTDHKELYKKILFLERRNEHLTLIYTKAVNEGRALKATRQGELEHSEQQIKLRDDRIKSLEFMLSTIKDQNERLTAFAHDSNKDGEHTSSGVFATPVSSRPDGDSPTKSGVTPHGHPSSKIVRPMRGGTRPLGKDKEGKKSMFATALSFFGLTPPPGGQTGEDGAPLPGGPRPSTAPAGVSEQPAIPGAPPDMPPTAEAAHATDSAAHSAAGGKA